MKHRVVVQLLSAAAILLLFYSHAFAEHSVAYVEPNSLVFQTEVMKAEAPAYPFVAKYRRWQGSGVFYVKIDPRSGKVTDVRVTKPTGFKVLDDSSIIALRSWVFKPNHLKEAKVPIIFQLQSRYSHWPDIPRGARMVPASPY